MAGYCANRSPTQGFYCILLHGHEGSCMSIDNRELWKETPGRPLFWGGTTRKGLEPTPQPVPQATPRPVLTPLFDPTELGAPEPTDESAKIARARGFVGELCGNCGSFNTRRNGACLLCDSCGETTGCS